MLRIWIRISLLFCLGIAALSALGMRFVNEDLAIALCSGRDTAQGLLGKPDQWSFTMKDSIWVDQSWLSHLFYYGSYTVLEEFGPVLLKGLLLTALLVVLFTRCRGIGVGLDGSLAAVALGTLSLAPFLQIRAENFGLLYFLLFTMFVVGPATWGKWRHLGCLAVLVGWANSHGSFMLGVALLGLRFLVTLACLLRPAYARQDGRLAATDRPASEPDRRDALAWLMTFLAAFGVVGLLNPYGLSNLAMPFRQLSASPMTGQSADWVSLLNWDQIWLRSFLQPLDVRPYLFFVAVTLVLAVLAAVDGRVRRAFQRLFPGKGNPEIIMEGLIPLVLFIMVIRFRRMILFAGPALVPMAAALIQANVAAIGSYVNEKQDEGLRWRLPLMGALLLSICAAVLAQQFYEKTVRPYAPGNPMRYDRPLISQLMSFDTYNMGVARFMKDNNIDGRMLTSWTAAAFLRFNDPHVQVFMDARDQSFYSDDIIKNYFSVMNSKEEDMPRTLEVLDRYGVSVIVLATTPHDFRLATLLMETRKWVCIYKDDEFLLLVRADAERFAPMLRASELDGLRYPLPDVRLTSEAVLSQFSTGTMRPELLKRLVEYVHRHPSPDEYILITLAMNGNASCLNSETRAFLSAEAQRLAAMDFMVPAGALKVVKSLINVTGILANDQAACRPPGDGPQWATIRDRAGRIYQELEQKYRGY